MGVGRHRKAIRSGRGGVAVLVHEVQEETIAARHDDRLVIVHRASVEMRLPQGVWRYEGRKNAV
jgi:hypothetical protein